jgi:hypothetical protein
VNSISAKLTIFISIVILLLILAKPVFAKIEINNFPNKIEVNKEFEIAVSLSNLSDPDHFLSIALHKESGNPYFGQTKNGDNWIEADDGNCKNFPKITVAEGSWSGKLVGKFFYDEKDFDNSLGNYILKVFKYTDSCNKSYSDDLSVELFDPNPPPTSKPTTVPTAKPTSSSSDTSAPSATSQPPNSPTPTKKPVIKTPTPIETEAELTVEKEEPQGTVLGETATQSAAGRNSQISVILLLLLIGGGTSCIVAAIIISYKQIRRRGSSF